MSASFQRGKREDDMQSLAVTVENLFKIHSKSATPGVAKETQKSRRPKEVVDGITTSATLSRKRLIAGMTVLGVVAEVNDSDVLMHLPNGVKVHINAARVSDFVTRQYRAALVSVSAREDQDAASGTDESDEEAAETERKLPVLSEFVRLGATLPVRVMGARRGGGKGVTFSLLASSVNDGLTRGMLSVGMTLAGCVLSVEDRGYSVDTGIEDCRAFVADESVADVDAMNVDERKHALSVGQPLLATVMAAAGARGPVQLSLSSDVVLPASEQAVFRALRAGARVLATVAAHVVNGVVVRFCGYLVGTIASEHIDGELPDVDTELQARLLFVDAESRRVALTALPHLVALSGASPLVSAERVAVGATVEGVVARRLAGVGLELALSDAPHRRCFVHTSNIADSVRDSEVAGDALVTAAAYAPGTVHAVRVLGESWLDGALVGSMRASVLASAIVSLHDAVPGMRLRARITRVGARTLHVLLGNGVRGTVAALHMADVPVRDVSARFHVQQQIDVRVLDVAPLRHRVYLSAKPTLVESALAVVSTLADAQPGTLTHAVVSKLVRAGVFVGLYGGLSGFIPLRELSVERVSDAATVCAVGDVVRCRVLGVDDSTRRVLLSLVVSDEAQRAVEEARSATSALVGVVDLNAVLTRGCDVGSFVDGAVTALDDESVTLELQIGPADDSVRVSTTMLRAHLGDTDAAATTSLAVGDVLRELLVLRVAGGRRRALVTVTHKRSLIDAARAGELLTAVADAVVGRVYAGAVTSVTPHAVFVGFAGVLTGYAARRELGDAPLPRAASVPFVVGQSVRALVREQQTRAADSDIAHAHSLSVSLRPSMCASPAGTYLAAYLADVGASSASTMGAVVRGVVLPHGDDDETSDAASLTLELADGECVLAVGAHAARTTTSDNADATESELALDRVGARAAAGAKLAAVVLDDVSAPRRVSLRRVLVDAARRRLTDAPDKDARLTIGQTVICAVVLTSAHYVVVSLPESDHAIALAAVHDFNTARASPPMPRVGERVSGVVGAIAGVAGASRTLLQLLPATTKAAAAQARVSSGDSLQPGALVHGEVASVGARFVGVAVGSARGRIDVSEVTDALTHSNPLAQFAVGNAVRARLLCVAADGHLELSTRESALESDARAHTLTRRAVLAADRLVARVRHVDAKRGTVELGVAAGLTGTLDALDVYCTRAECARLASRFALGAGVAVRAIRAADNADQDEVDESLAFEALDSNNVPVVRALTVGAMAVARVLGASERGSGTRVALPSLRRGIVGGAAATSIAVGSYVTCVVDALDGGEDGAALVRLCDDNGDGADAERGEDDTATAQVALDALSVGDVVTGTVIASGAFGIEARLSRTLTTRVDRRELSDDAVKAGHVAAAFRLGSSVRARVTNVDRAEGIVHVTMRRSAVDGVPPLRFDDLQRGAVVTARVTRVEPYGLFVRIDHSEDLVGLVHVRNLTDGARPSLETLRSDYPIGTTLRVLVFRVDAAKRRVSLALKPSLLAAAARNAALIEHSVDGGDGDNVNDDAGDDAADDADDDASDEVLTENAATHDDGRRGEKRKAAAVLAVPFEWPRGDADDVSKRRRVSDDIAAASTADVVDDDAAIDRGDVGERADVDTDNRRGARPNAQAIVRRREADVVARETALVAAADADEHDDGAPMSLLAHERQVTATPTSARAWIAYMAAHAAANDVTAARAVAQRALLSVPMSDAEARHDVWTALLNLELAYGSAASVKEVFERAVRQNDAESMHMKMATLYAAAAHADDATRVLDAATRKFGGTSMRVWTALGEHTLRRGDTATFRKTLQRASSMLPRASQVDVVSRFAQLEYAHGAVERARTLFEGLLANHPKRLDQWLVYADMERKHGHTSTCRRVFERVSSLKLPAKQMRAVLKRWLAFEQEYGTPADAQVVRQRARDFVEETQQ